MALQKDVPFNNGFTGNYHKISSMHIDYRRNVCMVTLDIYKDKETRDASKDSISSKSVMLNDISGDPTRADVYVLIKATEDYIDSLDV